MPDLTCAICGHPKEEKSCESFLVYEPHPYRIDGYLWRERKSFCRPCRHKSILRFLEESKPKCFICGEKNSNELCSLGHSKYRSGNAKHKILACYECIHNKLNTYLNAIKEI